MPPQKDDTTRLDQSIGDLKERLSIQERLLMQQQTNAPKEGWKFWRATLNTLMAVGLISIATAMFVGRDDIKDMKSQLVLERAKRDAVELSLQRDIAALYKWKAEYVNYPLDGKDMIATAVKESANTAVKELSDRLHDMGQKLAVLTAKIDVWTLRIDKMESRRDAP